MERTVEAGDRRTGLILFGLLALILAGICVLQLFGLAVTMLFGTGLPGLVATPVHPAAMAPALVSYLFLAVFLAALGVGSMLGRRWARALMLIVSALWLAGGTVGLAFAAYLLPRLLAVSPASRELARRGALGMVVAIPLAVGSIFLILLPLAIFLFYRSPRVKAACERLDPDERWTDRTPLPVIALALLAALGGLKLLSYGILARAYLLFGAVIPEAAGKAIFLATAAVWLVLAWGLYRRRRFAWAAALALSLLFGISGAATLLRFDFVRLLAWMGPPLDTPAARALAPAFTKGVLVSIAAAVSGLWIGFLIWMGKYFRKTPAPPLAP
jgi:hypothetical protein